MRLQLLRALSVILCLVILLLQSSAGASPQVIEDLINVRFQADVRVFASMAALNVAGFDLHAEDLRANPVRQLVRDQLSQFDPDLRSRLRAFHEFHNQGVSASQLQATYISYALLLDGPPHFRLTIKPAEIPPDARALAGFEALLEEFWQKGHLAELWETVRPQYVQAIEAYRPFIRSMILGTLRYMRTEPRVALDREVTFIPDLLNGYGFVNARNIGHNYIVVVGPSRTQDKLMQAVRHEYLHFLMDPLILKYVDHLPEPEPFLKRVRELPAALERYRKDFALVVTESLIQMAELRLNRDFEKSASRIVEAYDQGLILAPYFESALQEFELRTEPLQQVFPNLIEGLSWERESKRDLSVAQLRKELGAGRAQSPAKQVVDSEAGSEVAKFLGRANQLLQAKDFEQAAELLEQVLKLEPRSASALFGMAQIAAQDQALERALLLYEQAATNAAEQTWIAGWSFLHRGDIYQFQGDAARAKQEWSKVLELPGDLRGAREAAATKIR